MSKAMIFTVAPSMSWSVIDHRRYNGASLIGLRGIVIKSHGSSDAYAFEQALRRAHDAARNGLVQRITQAMPEIRLPQL
jgi:glycerol-3-phosphate acyltransferase PlsX